LSQSIRTLETRAVKITVCNSHFSPVFLVDGNFSFEEIDHKDYPLRYGAKLTYFDGSGNPNGAAEVSFLFDRNGDPKRFYDDLTEKIKRGYFGIRIDPKLRKIFATNFGDFYKYN